MSMSEDIPPPQRAKSTYKGNKKQKDESFDFA